MSVVAGQRKVLRSDELSEFQSTVPGPVPSVTVVDLNPELGFLGRHLTVLE